MTTFINHLGTYVPDARVDNARFSELTGQDADWFVARTGIHSRSRASEEETTTSMGLAAVRDLLARGGEGALEGVDLIIGASYTPDDTLSTMPAVVQRTFGIEEARVYFLSTACSSFISGLELAKLILGAGEARRALIVVSEHNSFYSDDADRMSGHLWGDGAAAVVVSADPEGALFSLDYVRSRGVACAGKGPEAIALRPSEGARGLVMAEGRDVFAQACVYLVEEVNHGLEQLGLQVQDIDWLVPHQANLRILRRVAQTLGLPEERCVVTVNELGNTGCASIPISIDRVLGDIKNGDRIAATAFGGGYSCGVAMLTRIAPQA